MYGVNSGPSGWPQQLLAYYHMADVPFPEGLDGPEEKVTYLNENTPLIFVPAGLDGAWYRALSCPMLVPDRDGLCHAVLPDSLGRAYYISGESGRRVYINRKNRGGFRREGWAVQRDLPGERLSLGTALGRLLRGMGALETAVLLLWSVLGGGLLLLAAGLLQSLLNDVVLSPDLLNGWGGSAGLGAAALGSLWMIYVGRRMAERISRRAALGLLPAFGARGWLAAGPTGPAERASLLAGLRDGGELLVRWALALLCGVGAGIPPLIGLARISPRLAWAAGAEAAALFLIAAVAAGRSAKGAPHAHADGKYQWLENQANDKRFGVERPFPFGEETTAGDRAGLLWLILPLLAAPVLFIAEREGLFIAELTGAAVLCLPAAVFPLAVLGRAPQAGRVLAELRVLLRQAGRGLGHDRELPKPGSALELKSVTFAYPGRREPVLRDVDLRVFPGEVLGIAGGTGAGKTTLARLMAGLLVPDAGQVYYGGIELGRYQRESVLRRIAMENGEDIRLLDRAPEELDGRTTVIFSSREEELARCERIFDLSEGRLTLRKQKERRLHE